MNQKHEFYNKNDSDTPNIVKDRNGEICLAYCKVCRCAEGSLPTHCPGKKIDIDTQDLIYENKLDYINNKWVNL